MTRQPRGLTSSDIVHVTVRGIGRRIIFEDDADKRKFLAYLRLKLVETDMVVYAWCLMDNHAHLLLRAQSKDLSKLMQRTLVSYAQYFNGRHGHVGKVFQNRFNSQPVKSEQHLLAAIRYVHRNALDSGVTALVDYAWSSYRELSNSGERCEAPGIVDSRTVLELFSNKEDFLRFHEQFEGADNLGQINDCRKRIDDAEAATIATRMLGTSFADKISAMPKKERNATLAELKARGLSIRQIERLTGIGRSIVSRA